MHDILTALRAELPSAALLFAYALLFALVEIEIEGPDGWAEKLPTWYRVTPWYARAFARVMGGKPLTGYHAFMIPLAFFSFHLGFAFGQPWSLDLELRVVARFGFWTIVWDALWFVFNPAFGWRRVRAGQVWWLGRVWLGPFPLEYWTAIGSSFAVAAVPLVLGTSSRPLLDHAAFCALEIAMGLLVAFLAPSYQRWYRHMRRGGADERSLVFRR